MKVGIIGLGRYGTALADVFASKADLKVQAGIDPAAEEAGYLEQVVSSRTNPKYTGDHRLSDRIWIRSTEQVARDNDILMVTVPVKFLYESARRWAKEVRPQTIICSAMKGINIEMFKRPTKVIRAVMNEYGKTALETKASYAALSGPTFAAEILEGRPMHAVIAANDDEVLRKLKRALTVEERLNLETSSDVKGVEYVGSMKNVVAIAGGAIHSMDLGQGSEASFLTYAIREVRNMIHLFGCNPDTIMTLAGIGDLIMTSSSEKSRNFQAGRRLVTEGNVTYSSDFGVVEGVNTSKAIYELFRDNQVLPYAQRHFKIFMDVYKAVHENDGSQNPAETFRNMLNYYQTLEFNLFERIIKNPFQRQLVSRRFKRTYESNGG